MRLDKYLATALGIPRSESRKKIAGGRVALGGVVCKKADTQIDENDPTLAAALAVEGRALATTYQRYVYLMLNKPQGVVSASRDARDTTVADLVRDAYPRRNLFPAGRLDKTSTGFILLTDDGGFAHDILAPGRHVEKQYIVTLDTPLTPEMMAGFAAGVTLADGQAMAPAVAEFADAPGPGQDPCKARVTLRQGVYHQIKRMFGVYGAGVNALHREKIGPVAMDAALAPGAWRELTAAELAALRQPHGGAQG
ncbi:MAG: pseudouridine synthase [Gemmiger sp.]|nr:pseudouridine synthase [Gemmiger sp.]